jgi:hypothetical protein
MGFPPGEIEPDAASSAPTGAAPAGAGEPAGLSGSAGAAEPSRAGEPAGLRWAVVPRPRPSTGDVRVDDAVARLDDLAGLPAAEHLAVFEYVHRRLTEALGDLDVPAPAHSGDASPGPGG